ncbi:MAG: sigma-70 family RNA polymerase sigma factor [Christensenellales bacterium]|jgi:RNA polymerase sporulation-specific sigma factor
MIEHEETLQLIAKAQQGDEEALSVLVLSNMPLIKSIVKRYKSRNLEYDDLIQLGSMGLIKAVKNFDCSYNVRFSTYAVPMIAGEIKRFIRDDGAIKVSRSIKLLAHKINNFIEERKISGLKAPTLNEIAEKFGIDIQDISFILDSSKMPLSLYSKTEDDSLDLIDKLVNDDSSDDVIDKMLIRDAINSLTDREKKIIIYRYFRDKTQSEIAAEIGISQVQISRLESKILEKIKLNISG